MDFLFFWVCTAILAECFRQMLNSCWAEAEGETDLRAPLLGSSRPTAASHTHSARYGGTETPMKTGAAADNEVARIVSLQSKSQVDVKLTVVDEKVEASATLKRKGSDWAGSDRILKVGDSKMPNRANVRSLTSEKSSNKADAHLRHLRGSRTGSSVMEEQEKVKAPTYRKERSAKVLPHAFSEDDFADERALESNFKPYLPDGGVVLG